MRVPSLLYLFLLLAPVKATLASSNIEMLQSRASCESKMPKPEPVLSLTEKSVRCQLASGNPVNQRRELPILDPSGASTTTVKGTCQATYRFLESRHTYYTKVINTCGAIENTRTTAINQKQGFQEVQLVQEEAKRQMESLLADLTRDVAQEADTLFSFNTQTANENKESAQKAAAPAVPQEDLAKLQALFNKIPKANEPLSKDKRNELVLEALRLPQSVKVVGESLAARVEVHFFLNQMKGHIPALQAAAAQLGVQSQTLNTYIAGSTTAGSPTGAGPGTTPDNRTSPDTPAPGSSGSSWLNTAALFAGPAMLAGVNLMNYQNAKNASQGSSTASLPTDQYALNGPKNPPSASLRSDNTGNPPKDNSTSAASKSKEGEESRLETSPEFSRFVSSGDPGDTDARLPRQFSGSLGNSPIFGGPSTAGDLRAGTQGESGQTPGKLDEIFEPQGKAGEGNVFNASGGSGLPKFGGGSSGSSDDSSLKDLFKTSPFPDLAGAGETSPAAGGNNPFFRDRPSGRGPASPVQSEAVPGSGDERSLFVRVKQFHERCQKKGCVTNEEGGKI